MNTIIATTAFIVTTAISAMFVSPCPYNNEPEINQEEQILHDWECKFIVEDCYTREGGVTYHFVDEVVENVDGSITFIANDGLLTTIPYPYFRLEKNPNKND